MFEWTAKPASMRLEWRSKPAGGLVQWALVVLEPGPSGFGPFVGRPPRRIRGLKATDQEGDAKHMRTPAGTRQRRLHYDSLGSVR